MIKEDNKVNRSHYNGLSGQRSEGILSSVHGNYSVNSVKGGRSFKIIKIKIYWLKDTIMNS